MKQNLSFLILFTILAFGLSGCVEKQDTNSTNVTPKPISTIQPTMAKTTPITELKITTIKPGTGAVTQTGDTVSVHYVGTFLDGSKFDSSRDRGTPFSFTLGQGRVIQGWDTGVVGMKVGELRKLEVPASMGYGPNDYGPIPGNSTLVFEIELLAIN